MSLSKDFQPFYRSDLLPVIGKLEAERKKIVRVYYLGLGVLALLFVVSIIVSVSTPEPERKPQPPIDPYANRNMGPQPVFSESESKSLGTWIYILLAGGLGYYFWFRPKKKEFKNRVKKELMTLMVPHVHAGLTYQREAGFSRSQFTDSGIFLTAGDRFTSEGLVSGTIGNTAIRFADVLSEEENKSEENTTNKQLWKTYNTLFKGSLFIADFNKNFNGRTVVLTDKMEKAFGRFGTMFQKMNKERDNLIKLENLDFEKAFAVYGTDSVEAHYILSPKLMERILTMKNKVGKIELSFVDSHVFVAVPFKGDFFNTSIFSTVGNYSTLESCHYNIKLMAGIVDDLDLNNRIWTKT